MFKFFYKKRDRQIIKLLEEKKKEILALFDEKQISIEEYDLAIKLLDIITKELQ